MVSFPNYVLFLATAQQPNPLQMLLPWILIFAAFYFLIIGPQRKREKDRQTMVSNLKKGDAVMTNGGIYATVSSVREDRVVLNLGDGGKLEVGKPFIQENFSRTRMQEKHDKAKPEEKEK